MPETKTIEEQVKQIIANHFATDPSSLSESTRIFEDLSGDSLDAIEITMALEETLGIEIGDEEQSSVRTVGDAIALARAKTGDV